MSHDSTARRVYGVTLETIVRRILATFDRATAADIEAGARWYSIAGTIAADLVAGDDVDTIEHAAALIAALSPRTDWARNVAGATAIAYGHDAVGCIGTNVTRANRVLLADDPVADLNATGTAPKIESFARNILGDVEAVTVDVWACRVANLDETRLSLKGAYDAVAHAYRLAARRRGVDPSTMQATTWVVARNGRAS